MAHSHEQHTLLMKFCVEKNRTLQRRMSLKKCLQDNNHDPYAHSHAIYVYLRLLMGVDK